jgi:CspA family cold shock protein
MRDPPGICTLNSWMCGSSGRVERACDVTVKRGVQCSATGDRMAQGTVKWFDRSRGFGFITPDNGSNDIFVHVSALNRGGMATLVEGQKVEYQAVISERGGHQRAEKLKAA